MDKFDFKSPCSIILDHETFIVFWCKKAVAGQSLIGHKQLQLLLRDWGFGTEMDSDDYDDE